MDREKLIDYIQNVIISIHENVRETRERKNWADIGDLHYIEARLLAFNEIIQILRITANDLGIPEKEIGL